MRTESEVRALVLQFRRYALQNPSSIRALHGAAVAAWVLSWVLNEATMGDVAFALSDGDFGEPGKPIFEGLVEEEEAG